MKGQPKKNKNSSKSQDRLELKTYVKPTLSNLGSITILTTGGSGNLGDVTGPNTPGKIPY